VALAASSRVEVFQRRRGSSRLRVRSCFTVGRNDREVEDEQGSGGPCCNFFYFWGLVCKRGDVLCSFLIYMSSLSQKKSVSKHR